jgi:hypothetical protein
VASQHEVVEHGHVAEELDELERAGEPAARDPVRGQPAIGRPSNRILTRVGA